MSENLIERERLKEKIYTIRGIKVMLDRDLAGLYGVTTGNLNKAVRRNQERFPNDFMFQLSKDEFSDLIFQNGSSSWGGARKLPHAFTELGVSMLSSVLRSRIAVEVNIRIMRIFVELRKAISDHSEYALLKETVNRIESRMDTLEANHVVDRIQLAGKATQLGRETQDIRGEVNKLSALFDEFQDAHIIIKRPEDGIKGG